jgi:hypothetical protein
MPRYISTKGSQTLSVAICPRCHFKRKYDDLVIDPNTNDYVCKFGCVDEFDPYRIPPRKPDDITLHHPRPDDPLDVPQE